MPLGTPHALSKVTARRQLAAGLHSVGPQLGVLRRFFPCLIVLYEYERVFPYITEFSLGKITD